MGAVGPAGQVGRIWHGRPRQLGAERQQQDRVRLGMLLLLPPGRRKRRERRRMSDHEREQTLGGGQAKVGHRHPPCREGVPEARVSPRVWLTAAPGQRGDPAGCLKPPRSKALPDSGGSRQPWPCTNSSPARAEPQNGRAEKGTSWGCAGTALRDGEQGTVTAAASGHPVGGLGDQGATHCGMGYVGVGWGGGGTGDTWLCNSYSAAPSSVTATLRTCHRAGMAPRRQGHRCARTAPAGRVPRAGGEGPQGRAGAAATRRVPRVQGQHPQGGQTPVPCPAGSPGPSPAPHCSPLRRRLVKHRQPARKLLLA